MSLPDANVKKRARRDSNAQPGPVSESIEVALYQKDAEFWFDDGTIILDARGTRFCVYKGVLAQHSLVFADMFTLPQPPSAHTAQDDGTPVVYVDDSPFELRHVLRVLLPNQAAGLVGDRIQPTIHALSAWFRLGHKYQIDHLVSQSLRYLQKYFPRDRKVWCALEEYVPEPLLPVHAIGVVNIARFTGCNSLLPTAFLVCCTLSAQELMRGYMREDGTQEKLDDADFVRCVDSQTKLMTASAEIMLRTFSPYDEDEHMDLLAQGLSGLELVCADDLGEGCQRRIFMALTALHKVMSLAVSVHMFSDWENTYGLCALDDLCHGCCKRLPARFDQHQAKLWDRLPDIFDIKVDAWTGGGA